MIVTEKTARELLALLGYNAEKFTLVVMARKLAQAGELPAEVRARVVDKSLLRTLRTIISCREKIEVVASEPVKPSDTYERSEYSKQRRPNSKPHESYRQDEDAAPHPSGKRLRKRGFQWHIFQALKGAEKRPLSKDDLIMILKEKFPKHPIAKIANNVNCFPSWLPLRYPDWRIVQVSDTETYYILRK